MECKNLFLLKKKLIDCHIAFQIRKQYNVSGWEIAIPCFLKEPVCFIRQIIFSDKLSFESFDVQEKNLTVDEALQLAMGCVR